MAKTARKLPVFEDMPAWGVFVFESHHDVDWRMTRRSHDFLKLLYLLDGDGRLETDHQTIELATGDAAIVPVGVRHRLVDQPGRPMSLYVLCLAPALWRTEPNLAAGLTAQRLDGATPVVGQVRGAMRQLLYEQTSSRPGFAAMMRGRSLQLLVAITRELGGDEADASVDLRHRIERYIDELDRRFFEATTIDDAAVSLGMSRRRFTELFRDIAGETWLHRVQRLRIDHARHLLRHTDRTVLSIAFECGFGDLSGFYRAFGRFERLSPTEWRARASGR
jgi:AraC-like DNA-binding protein